LLTFDVNQYAAAGCANFMNAGVYAFGIFSWDGITNASIVSENMTSVDGTAGITYESGVYGLTFFKHVNVVHPGGNPYVAGERGDYRHYTGAEIIIKKDGVTKLTLTNCRTTATVYYPPGLSGPGGLVTGNGWGTIDPLNSDAAWVAEFSSVGHGQVDIEFGSISNVVQASCGSTARYNFDVRLYPAGHGEEVVTKALIMGKNGGLLKTPDQLQTIVDMSDINLSLNFSAAVNGGESADQNNVYGNKISSDPGGAAPGGITTVGSSAYWEIGTTLESFTTDLTFDLASYPGITNINNIRMLVRETEDNAWEVYSGTQTINGNTITCVGVTSFSQWVPGSTGADPLTVELSSFKAAFQLGVVNLSWQTATEINNYGFEIERKIQGSNASFEKIGFVGGNGNSNSTKEYTFEDEKPHAGKVQYRLKQIDNDGSFEYSNVVEVDVNQSPTEFSLFQNYPNPFNPSTTIKYGVSDKQIVEINVFDVLGTNVASLVNEQKEPGDYEIRFDASTLSSGIYFYTMTAGNFRDTKKLVLLR
ncbi:MAG: T9SS type A sorting domain-containing protein, partial [Ignavibacteriaceae bacterium]|nr:T9SS type A sorting domain-containing protein [Ignavibacteriaceae bacterium]